MVDLDVSSTAVVVPVKPEDESSGISTDKQVSLGASSSSSDAPVPALSRAACLPLMR